MPTSARRIAALLVLACAALAVQAAPARSTDLVTPVRSCASLKGLSLARIGGPGSDVSGATQVDSEPGPACVVDGVLAPAVRFQLRLPLTTWTQRYLQVGCGGLCGRISLDVGAAEGCLPLQAGGFAVAATDMGHEGGGAEFGHDPQRRADFAYRAQHVTAAAAKYIQRVFYGRAPSWSYFSGCSDGGREALVAAQRYPKDFDGIIAGAPALNFQVQNALVHAWQARANTGAGGKPILLASRLPLLHRAVLERCDALDGRSDGLIVDPRACSFDPGTLECAGQVKDDCLSREEVAAVRRLYDGPRDPASGVRLTLGGPLPGSELNWAGVFVPTAADQPLFGETIALQALRHLVFDQSPGGSFQLAQLSFDEATFMRLRPRHALFDATNPNLSAFAARGGKLLLWHGWADPHISPLNTIAYHEALHRELGIERAAAFERLYLLPGVSHCGGGEGPDAIDLLTPLLRWVEEDTAPAAIVALRTGANAPTAFGQPAATRASPAARPAPPPPAGPDQLAIWPAAASAGPSTPPWLGADFFQPYRARTH